MFFKKSPDKSVISNKDAIAKNVKELGTVAVKLAEHKAAADKVKELANEYKYVSPKESPDTARKENQIADKIGDMNVAVAKALKTKQFDEIEELLSKIRTLISER